MIGLLILATLAYALAGAAKGAMDTLQFHFSASIFARMNWDFWKPDLSWRNKYKDRDPAKGPRFPGSTTVFVSLTDGWHLMQMIYLALQRTAIVMAMAAFHRWAENGWTNLGIWAGIWAGLAILHASGFHATYSVLLKAKKPTAVAMIILLLVASACGQPSLRQRQETLVTATLLLRQAERGSLPVLCDATGIDTLVQGSWTQALTNDCRRGREHQYRTGWRTVEMTIIAPGSSCPDTVFRGNEVRACRLCANTWVRYLEYRREYAPQKMN